jgi:hypothetical protein
MPRLANAETRGPISRREMFKTNSGAVYPRREGKDGVLYVVYSYGDHFPMWVYDGHINQWFGNQDRASRTTSKQQSQTRPDVEMTMCDTTKMHKIIWWGGYTQYTAKRITREETA